jgi:hypothetical protein
MLETRTRKRPVVMRRSLTKFKGCEGLFIFNPLAFQIFYLAQRWSLQESDTKLFEVLFRSLSQDFYPVVMQASNPTGNREVVRLVPNPFLEFDAWQHTDGLSGKNAVETSCHVILLKS